MQKAVIHMLKEYMPRLKNMIHMRMLGTAMILITDLNINMNQMAKAHSI